MEAIAAQRAYIKLSNISKHSQQLSSILQLLEWDQEVFMPPGAADARALQHKTLAGLLHKQRSGRTFQKALSELIDLDSAAIKGEGLRPDQSAALYWWRRDFLRDKALSTSFVEEFSQLTSKSMNVWRSARQQKNFSLFSPYLEKIVNACRRKADLIGYKEHPYDALLDEFEPEMTTKELTPLFTAVAAEIKQLLKSIKKSPQVDDTSILQAFAEEHQLAFSRVLLENLGYDFSKGRLDLSTHPFSSSLHPTDSRITTRVDSNNLMGCLSAALHEGGHSLYEMGLPQELWGTPLGASVSLGIHESQSRWWECYIGLSKPFWKYFFPLLQRQFPEQLNAVPFDSFYCAINKVEPTFIRVEADEVTYPLHVALRFSLERQLIEGSLKVKELPEAWNSMMHNLLGITPPDVSLGCLQDIHWSMGAFGYFPTYALGSMYAAQLFSAFSLRYSSWHESIAAGQLNFVREWLQQNIYQYGRRYNSRTLMELATGQPFSAKFYIDYLKGKYHTIYPPPRS